MHFILRSSIAQEHLSQSLFLLREMEDYTTGVRARCHAILCLCRIGVWDCVFEIRQLLVGDTLLRPE